MTGFNIELKHCDPLLVSYIVEKLPSETTGLFETKLGGTTRIPIFEQLKEFLDTRIKTLDAIEENKSQYGTVNASRPKLTPKIVQPEKSFVATSSSNAENVDRFNAPHKGNNRNNTIKPITPIVCYLICVLVFYRCVHYEKVDRSFTESKCFQSELGTSTVCQLSRSGIFQIGTN